MRIRRKRFKPLSRGFQVPVVRRAGRLTEIRGIRDDLGFPGFYELLVKMPRMRTLL